MITCRELADLLFGLTSGCLRSEQQAHAEEHLSSCPSCAAYLESYRLTIRLSRQLPRLALPVHLARRLRAILEEGSSIQKKGN